VPGGDGQGLARVRASGICRSSPVIANIRLTWYRADTTCKLPPRAAGPAPSRGCQAGDHWLC